MAGDRIHIVLPKETSRPDDATYMQFKLDVDEHDWPPADWEAMWTRREDYRTYRVLSIPAFVHKIAVNDLVWSKTGPDHDVHFDHKLDSGGHSTVRVFMRADATNELIEQVIAEIRASGCEIQRTSWDAIIAVDIPTEEAFARLYEDCLIPRSDAGDLSVESACMTFGSAPDAWPPPQDDRGE
jgi:hypothetical protein